MCEEDNSLKELRTLIKRSFTNRSIYMGSDSLRFIANAIKDFESDRQNKVIGKIIEELEGGSSELVNLVQIKEILLRSEYGRSNRQIIFKIEDAYNWKPVKINKTTKKLVEYENKTNSLKKLSFECLRKRFELIKQLLMEDNGCCATLETLYSKNNSKVKVIGMLSRGTGNMLIAEDLNGTVKLDTRAVQYDQALYFEGGIFVFEGVHSSGTLALERISLPCLKPDPVIEIEETKRKRMATNSKDMIIFLSDVHLNNKRVLKGIQQIFEGFLDSPPNIFVLCGRFLETQLAYGYTEEGTLAFKNFLNIFTKYIDKYITTQFIFVPSLEDAPPINISPKMPLPPSITGLFKEYRNIHFVTSPCRIHFKEQTIVVCRDNLIEKMCRSSIYVPPNSTDISTYFCDTIWSQRHYSPLPLHINAILPQFDHIFHLWPAPDVLVLADKYKAFVRTMQSGTVIINPGSFPLGQLDFQVYYPHSKLVEASTVYLDE